jgi:hypothetical protein
VGVRKSLNYIGLYTNLGGVDVRAGNANYIQGGRTFMKTPYSRRLLFLNKKDALNLLIRCALLKRRGTRIIVLSTYVCSASILAISYYPL